MADEWDKYAVESDEWEQYATTPKRQFNTIAEAQAAMQEARVNQRNAEMDASGIMPWITQPPKMMPDATNFNNTVNAIVPSLLGGGMVGNTILKGGAALVPTIGRQIAAGMGGGAAGGAIAPADNMQQRGVNAGFGALAGGAMPMAAAIINKFPKIINLGGRKTGQKVAELSDKGIDKVGDYLSKKYDVMFDKLRTVNGTRKPDSIITAIDDVGNQFPGQDMGKLSAIKTRLMKIQKSGKELTGEELHNLKQEVRTLIPKSVWKGSSEADAMQAAKKNIYFKVNEELGALGGDEYKALSAEFKKFKDSEQSVRNILYNEGAVSNQNLMRQLDVPKENALKYLNSQIPNKEDQFLDALMAYRRGQNIKKAAAFGLPVAGGIGAAYNALSGR